MGAEVGVKLYTLVTNFPWLKIKHKLDTVRNPMLHTACKYDLNCGGDSLLINIAKLQICCFNCDSDVPGTDFVSL